MSSTALQLVESDRPSGQALQRQGGSLQLRSLDELMKLGDIFAKSGYFSDAKDAARAVVKILAGQDMGLSPFAAMNGIFLNSQGKLGYAANLIAAQIKKSGRYDYRVREWTEEGCKIEFFEQGQSVGFGEFTKADAQRANLLQKDTYKSYPKGLFFARALTQGARAFTPELFGGNAIYTPDEIGGTGETIEITAEAVNAPAPVQLAAARDPQAKTLGDLVTPKQLWIIRGMGRELNLDVERECQIQFQAKLEELSTSAARAFIGHLKSKGAVGPVEAATAQTPASVQPAAPASQPIPLKPAAPETAADSLTEDYVERIKTIIADQGKSQGWFAYHKEHVAGKNLPALASLLSRLEVAGSKKLIEEIEGPIFEALSKEGVSGKEAIEKIAQIADGECGLEQMEYATLVNVRDGLKAWLKHIETEASREAAMVAPF